MLKNLSLHNARWGCLGLGLNKTALQGGILMFIESKDAIISTLAIVNAPVDALTQEELEVCRVLEPFEQVTVEISGEVQKAAITTLFNPVLYMYMTSR